MTVTVGFDAVLGSEKVRQKALRTHRQCAAMMARVRERRSPANAMLMGGYTFGPKTWMRIMRMLDPAEQARYARRWPKRHKRMAGK